VIRRFLTLAETPNDVVHRVLEVAEALRDERRRGEPNEPALAGQTLAMIFEKPSLRTRVSFEQAMIELGGHAIVLGQHEIGLGKRESVADVSRVLGGMVHGIAARVFDHATLHQLADHAGVPVINMLSDYTHPCQALADLLTIRDEFGPDLAGRSMAFVGDGNNVARSLAWACAHMGMRFVLAAPEGYTLEAELFEDIRRAFPAADVEQVRDPRAAARGADVIVTDTFVSMGQEDEKEARLPVFAAYQVNASLLREAAPHAIVLHCLPAYRGVEITDEVLDGPQSRAFPEAHNRLHAQKGLLAVIMGGDLR
jgi:ornithine carbamoyltransferase